MFPFIETNHAVVLARIVLQFKKEDRRLIHGDDIGRDKTSVNGRQKEEEDTFIESTLRFAHLECLRWFVTCPLAASW